MSAQRGAHMAKSVIIEQTPEKGEVIIRCFSCAHCKRVVALTSTTTLMGFCVKCFYPTCVACGAKDECDPYEKKLERAELKARVEARIRDSL